MDVYIHRETDFNKSLAALRRAGGQASLAADTVDRIIGALARGITEPKELGKLTNHGEPRIEHCFKYDLPGYHRLVCLRNDAAFWLLFVGNHAACDEWLERNRGLRVVANNTTKRLSLIQDIPLERPFPPQTRKPIIDIDTALLVLLPDEYQDYLPPLRPKTTTIMMALTRASSDDDLMDAVSSIHDDAVARCYLNVLLAIRDRDLENAIAYIDRYENRAEDWHKHTPDALRQAVEAEVNADSVINLRDLSDIELHHFLTRSTFLEWMVYLHPDQKRLAHGTFPKPVVLRGISGSGKTCVIVHRATALADRYPEGRIGVFTLNRALAVLISQLLDQVCPQQLRQRIEVHSVYDICEAIVRHFEPKEHLLTYDPKSGELADESWEESFTWSEQQIRLSPIVDSLKDRGIDSERYIRDEFIWIRSAFSVESSEGARVHKRESYLVSAKAPREGRAVPFSADWRARTLESLACYEEWLRTGGFIEPAALSLAAHAHVEALRSAHSVAQANPLQFRCVLIDEDQDLGAVELDVLASLAPALPDGLFLAGDSSQQVFPKFHSLASAGLESDAFVRRYLRKNYRNTKQILEAGLKMLERFGALSNSDVDGQVLRPELSARESAKPVLFRFETAEQETRAVVQFIRQLRSVSEDAPIGIVVCGLREDNDRALNDLIAEFAARGLDVFPLRRDSKMADGRVFLSALETAKGFEFSCVIIMRCGKGIMPDAGAPVDEGWRDARRLYVAMTRARDSVVITSTHPCSPLVEGLDDSIITSDFVFEDEDAAQL